MDRIPESFVQEIAKAAIATTPRRAHDWRWKGRGDKLSGWCADLRPYLPEPQRTWYSQGYDPK